MRYLTKLIVALSLVAGAAYAQQNGNSNRNSTAFDRMKSLEGEWEVSVVENGKELSTVSTFRLVSGGSVLMNDLAPGTPHEMVTMFHKDGDDVLATHYCMMNNQPRMRAVSTEQTNAVAFEFKDATNLPNPAAAHMAGVKFIILDSNHHIEEWTVVADGQTSIRRFDFHRKH
jgi:hypothetical protein